VSLLLNGHLEEIFLHQGENQLYFVIFISVNCVSAALLTKLFVFGPKTAAVFHFSGNFTATKVVSMHCHGVAPMFSHPVQWT
jgi:hypothetical protein